MTILLFSFSIALAAAVLLAYFQHYRMFKRGGLLPDVGKIKKQVQEIETAHAITHDLNVRQELHVRELSDKYKLIFEHSIVGLSFYTPDGWLIDANEMMREICHFDSADGDEFFSRVNLFDIQPFNEILDKNNIEDYWACSLSIIPERNMHVYLEINLSPVYDASHNLVYISVSARDVSGERELYMQEIKNDKELKRTNKAIEQYEMELRYMMDACEMQAWRISLEKNTIEFYQGLSSITKTFTLQQLPHIFVDQDDAFVKALYNPSTAFLEPLFYIGLMHPVVTGKKTEKQWIQINSIPEYDENGQLKGAFGIWRNINQLMRKQEQLKQETERANASGQLKSVFLANMTHEIRTPLNAIVGFADVLPLMSSKEEKQELIRVIMNNCDMLLRLINDILAVSSLESDGIKVEPKEVDFAQLFDELCETLKTRVQDCVPAAGQEAGKSGVEFIKDNPYPSLTVNVDGGRLQQVLTNFMTNSVKYTHQGHIKLGYRKEVREGKNGLYLYCEDTGDGIAKENQEKIFERFYKVNDFIQGTGLGLAICKAIADASNGDIGVESEGQGKGTTFWIWVPVNESF